MSVKKAFLLIGFVCFLMPVYGKQTQPKPPGLPPHTISDYDQLISYYRYYKPDSALYYTQAGLAFAKRTRNDNGEALMLNQLGIINDNLGKFDESRGMYLAAHDIYKRTGFKKGEATENIRLGVVEMRKGNYDKAIGYFLESLRVSEESGNVPGKMEAYTTLGEAYVGQRKYDEAIKYYTIAEGINNTIPMTNVTLNLYVDLGIYYREKGNYDKAKAYLEKGISVSNKPQYQGLFITLTNTLASVYAKQGFKTRAIQLQKTALAKAIEINNYLRQQQTLTGLAENYAANKPDSALYYFKRALDLVTAKGAQKQEIEILSRMADIYHLQGNDTQAYLAKKEEHDIADKYFYQDMAKQIVSLQAQYELNKSEANVKELQFINRQGALERRVILLITAGVVILLIAMMLFYFRTNKLNGLLNKANAELKETNTVKDKLFSVLAHDLRTPFATIINLLYVINDDDLPADERKELINMVSVTSTASMDILNNLLKWGETQLKGIRLNMVNLDPKDIIERNIAMLQGTAGLKSITINNQIGANVNVLADADHFEFVLRNLLSNAIKFTPQNGTITLSTTEDKKHRTVCFIVKDTGVGIPAGKLKQIFDISNISTDGTEAEKGTSLGLVLCREFMEANHGKILVESTWGQGSAFMFSLKKATH